MSNIHNDFKVVRFKNISDFEFTPVLGAMYDGRPVFGSNGTSIMPNEEVMMPYHIGKRVATNLAKQIFINRAEAPAYGEGNDKSLASIYDEKSLVDMVDKIFIDQYQEDRPTTVSDTDKLMQKFEELNKTVAALEASQPKSVVDVEAEKDSVIKEQAEFQDKADVITELEKRGIDHDKRKSKNILMELLK